MALKVTDEDLLRAESAEASNDRSESNMGLMRQILVMRNCLREQGLNAHVMVKRNDCLGALERGELGDIGEVLKKARQMAIEEKAKRGTRDEETRRTVEKVKAIQMENTPVVSEEVLRKQAQKQKETEEEGQRAEDPEALIPNNMRQVDKWTVPECDKMMRIWSKVARIGNLHGDMRSWEPRSVLKKSTKPDRVGKAPLVDEKREHLKALMLDYQEVMRLSMAV